MPSTTKFPKKVSIDAKYGPAMSITTQTEANAYFERCVEHSMRGGLTRLLAEETERSNLAYYAGYYSSTTRRRVERLFNCAHPIFGPIIVYGSPSPDEAFEMGKQFAMTGLVEKGSFRGAYFRDSKPEPVSPKPARPEPVSQKPKRKVLF